MLDEQDIQKIKKIISERKKANEFYKINSKTYEKFLDMEEQAFSSNALSKKMKELIATGISIVINCESCMEWHIHKSIKSGATKEEILDAINIGIEMSGGPGTVSSRFALKILEYYKLI